MSFSLSACGIVLVGTQVANLEFGLGIALFLSGFFAYTVHSRCTPGEGCASPVTRSEILSDDPSSAHELLTELPDVAGIQAQVDQVTKGLGGELAWPGLLRRLDRIDASFRD